MKRIFTIAAALIMTANVWAQAPEKMSYQAVVRDAGNALLISTGVGMQISILQGSTTGTAIYVETQSPTTNANGLVSLEIGNGTPTTGTFAAIDWSVGPYFIKTETDPTGGSTYTITGTSQLMSVPYALHANTADSIVGGLSFTEVDGSVTNEIQDLQLSGNNLTITNNGTATTIDLSPYLDNTDTQLDSLDIANMGFITSSAGGVASPTYSVGDSLEGGIIFYVDASGQHGLMCAKEDQSTAIAWSLGTGIITGAQCEGIGSGKINTMLIVSSGRGDYGTSYAAKVCATYTTYVTTPTYIAYGGWYMPNITELQLIAANQTVINNTAAAMGGTTLSSVYHSSREGGVSTAANAQVVFMSGGTGMVSKSDLRATRAIREF